MLDPNQGSLHEWADFRQLLQLGRALLVEPVFNGFFCFHANQYRYWLIYVNKKSVSKNLFLPLGDAQYLFRPQ